MGMILSDVSISGRADLVDDNIKKKDLWNDSLKAWYDQSHSQFIIEFILST